MGRAGGFVVNTIYVVSEPSFLMCLAAECDRRAVTATRGHLGQPGAGGADRLVGRRCRCCGHGGGCAADAPLLSPSGRHLLVLISHLKLRELTCLEFFVEKMEIKLCEIRFLGVGENREKIGSFK